MMRVIPNWRVKYVGPRGVIAEFKVSSDFYLEVLAAIGKINAGVEVTSILIERSEPNQDGSSGISTSILR